MLLPKKTKFRKYQRGRRSGFSKGQTQVQAGDYGLYELALELARGKLNDVRNQMADWMQMGLRISPELSDVVAEARRGFVKAAMSADEPEA